MHQKMFKESIKHERAQTLREKVGRIKIIPTDKMHRVIARVSNSTMRSTTLANLRRHKKVSILAFTGFFLFNASAKNNT